MLPAFMAAYPEVVLDITLDDAVVDMVANGYDAAIRIGEVIERSEEHTSELQSLMRISYAVFCLKKKKKNKSINNTADEDVLHTEYATYTTKNTTPRDI